MLSKLNFGVIVRDHLATLYDNSAAPESGKKLKAGDIAVLFGVPVLPTLFLLWRQVWLTDTSIGTLMTAMSVFGALLFNLLILVYDIAGRDPRHLTEERSNTRKSLIAEIHANVAFAVLVTILTIIVLLPGVISENDVVRKVSSPIVYFFVGVFVLTLLLVLKRMHVLLAGDIESSG